MAWPEPTFEQLLQSLLDDRLIPSLIFELRALVEGTDPSKIALRPFNPHNVVQLEPVRMQLLSGPDQVSMISTGKTVDGTKVWLAVGPPFLVPHLSPRQIVTLLHAREHRYRCQHCQHVGEIARGADFQVCSRCGSEQRPEL